VREVKKKVLVVAVALMAVAMLATPFVGTVMAAPANKVPARAAITTLGYEIDPATDIRVTDDGIEHITYLMMWGIIELYEGDNPIPIIVDWVDICEGLYNPKCDKSVWRFDEVWTIDGAPAFVGTDHVKTVGPLIAVESMKSHMILHGVGDYEGQVLNLWFVPDEGLVGTWLKP
jgi:hypothetical protein